ncbi:TonB-dependent receptor plug domain-containing protein [Candidatus Marithrix sp. Canyon 246]|uniref:TonB-dependent receptor plug domain-containing protein n=1 Tax=Candidatus Marithrix sp. Canyon 246 TaxID=1827136 RepID=UPI00084A0A7B|nr:TonB-dependent receptor [Candidatus Marithrix sp. Canyon 246]
MYIRLLIILINLTIISFPSYAEDETTEADREAIEFLKGLKLEELVEVEVTLDNVFNVFDGLIKARKVTIATGKEQTTDRAPSVTTVITAQDIEATGATDLDEVLEMVPGLHVARNRAYNPIYIIRGIYSTFNPQILMLVNGIPINRLYFGNKGAMWAGMPVANIARIEVIRGPGSAVFGANAFAGVINIITKTKKDIEGTEIGTRIGSFNTQDAYILHGGTWAGFDIASSLEYRNTDGHNEIIDIDAQSHFDNQFGTNASLAPGGVNMQKRNLDARLDISKENWQLRSGYQGRRNIGTGAGTGEALDPIGHFTDDRFNADLTYHNSTFTENWDVTAQLSYFQTRYNTNNQTIFPSGAFGGAYPNGMIIDTSISERNNRLDLSGFYTGFKKHTVRLGIGYHYGEMYKIKHYTNTNPTTGFPIQNLMDISNTSYSFIPEGSRKNWHVFLQDVWNLTPNWEWTTGFRYDNYSDFKSTLNPRFALSWQPISKFSTKLMYASAFRAPTFSELYITSNPVHKGNLNLNPETIDTWELAFNYHVRNNLHLATNLFSYKWSDGIRYVPGASKGIFIADNVGIQKAYGLEFEARWKMTKKSSLLANYAFVKASDENNKHDAGNYPQHSAYVRSDWLLMPNWFLDTQINWVSERQRAFGDSRSPVDDYTTVDFTLRRKNIKKGHWNFAVSVRNLFDVDAREPSQGPDSNGVINIPYDLPLAGRHYWLELRYHF